ncbi:hypothetical protein AKJ50_01760 [candidate division MSBL1 archaeon SCGC-AAA382A13]|uniref:Uncharacterized protein n=1 Tax=candidate division MSBL1 archaeon SCGC-AAA382A13 TaxID=1698279 RepID=A0A133VF73_9EURY|nr:hypothetical protein AKJ50_01760 [candidate division MSBL1 archaeon SCGC-AAA382A13]
MTNRNFNTPEDTVNTMIDSYNNRKVNLYLDSYSSKILENVSKAKAESAMNVIDERNGELKLQEINVDAQGSNATATVTIKLSIDFNGERMEKTNTVDLPLIEEDDGWKIDNVNVIDPLPFVL